MTKTIQINLMREASHVISEAKAVASKNGVKLIGDDSNGRFSGAGIEGQYLIEEGTMAIVIHRKPMLLPWTILEDRLLDFFGKR